MESIILGLIGIAGVGFLSGLAAITWVLAAKLILELYSEYFG